MIRHICMFTLKDKNKESIILEFFKRAEQLKALETIKKFNVVRNAEKPPASNYDVALIFDFETVENLNEYQKCNQHIEFGEYVSSVRLQRACIDFEL